MCKSTKMTIIYLKPYSLIHGVTERCEQILGVSSTPQNKRKCPYQHVMKHLICDISERVHLISAKNLTHALTSRMTATAIQ
jgi:hypothetical protein